MGSAFPAILVSLLLISAVGLGLGKPLGVRRRIVLVKLRGSPASHSHSGTGPQVSSRERIAMRSGPNIDRYGDGYGGLHDDGHEGLHDVSMMLELVAAMLDSGAGLARALALIADCAVPSIRRPVRAVVAALEIGTDWETAWRSSGAQSTESENLKAALAFAALTGAPSSAILYAQAARLRREQFRAAEKRAAALGVKLVIPLGLCSLPAFICLGVVPVLLGMLPTAG
ncbi:type II secretion system F family protein [bacterium RCC_150]